jgi:phosphomannomutase
MAQLRAVVKAGRADIGFAHDADGERLGIVTEQGQTLSEEITFPLVAAIRWEKQKRPVVTNVSTSSRIDRVASRYGTTVIRTPVGQPYISEAIIENNAILGGEGSGGISVPEIHATHDSAAAIGVIMERLAVGKTKISNLVVELPQVAMMKYNIEVEPNRLYSLLQSFRLMIEREKLSYDLTDGVKVTLPNGWVHARASNTESLIRIIVEADDTERARELVDWARDRLRK